MLYNVLLQEQLLSPSRCKLAILLLRTQALDVWTPLFPVDPRPPFSTKLNYTYLRGTNKFSEIQLCGKRGVQTHVFKGNKLI
jgi:hypothetical protein